MRKTTITHKETRETFEVINEIFLNLFGNKYIVFLDAENTFLPIEKLVNYEFDENSKLNLKPKKLEISDIIAYFGTDYEDSITRKREVVKNRQLAHYFARKYTSLSTPTIGALICNKNHATVLHSCKVINNLIETDRAFAKEIERHDEHFKSLIN